LLVFLTAVGTLAGAGRAAESNDALTAVEIVRTYYVFQGTEPTSERLTAGLPAARELLQSGWERQHLEAVILRLFRERESARTAPFEVEMRDWMAKQGVYLAAALGVPTAIATPPQVEEDSTEIVREDRFAEEPDSDPRADVVEPREAPATVEAAEPVEPAVAQDALADQDTADEVAVTGRWDDEGAEASVEPDTEAPPAVVPIDAAPEAAERSARGELRVKVERPGISMQARTGMILLGTGLLASGMVGGAVNSAQCAKASGFTPGHTPIIGAIPFVGAPAAYEYWKSYGNEWSVKMYAPVAAAMTVIEIAGATLIVVGATAPGERRRSAARPGRAGVEEIAVVPSVGPAGARLTVVGRF